MENSDTLDIRPINPTTPHGHAGNHGGEAEGNNPEAAEVARAKIAAFDHAAPAAAEAGTVPDKLPQPVSPAEEYRRSQSTLQLANLKGKAQAGLSAARPAHHQSHGDNPTPPITEQPPPAKASKSRLPSRLKPVISAVASFLLIFAILKSPVLFSQLGYLFGDKPTVNEQIGEVAISDSGVIGPAPLITIPKININAPIVYEPSVQENQIQKALQGGVVHYGNTPKPGQPGNSVIVGHSSNDWWEPGNYKFVFVLLDKLVTGDNFSINHNSVKYVYEVTEVKIVKPTDLSVLAPTPTPSVTLITCTPPGFSTNRLIIRAKQISPEPGQTQVAAGEPAATANNSSVLPSSAPSFGYQVNQAWSAFAETIGGLFGQRPEPSDDTSAPQTLPRAL